MKYILIINRINKVLEFFFFMNITLKIYDFLELKHYYVRVFYVRVPASPELPQNLNKTACVAFE